MRLAMRKNQQRLCGVCLLAICLAAITGTMVLVSNWLSLVSKVSLVVVALVKLALTLISPVVWLAMSLIAVIWVTVMTRIWRS